MGLGRIPLFFLATSLFLLIGVSCREVAPTEKKCNEGEMHSLIGTEIPDHRIKVYHKGVIKSVKLGDFKGKWLILFFYPGDFTFVCPTELKELSDYYTDFRESGAEILSISTDSVYSHRAWQISNPIIKKVTFPMGSERLVEQGPVVL